MSKLQNDEHGAAALNPVIAEESDASKGIATKWESSSGLDDMMLSLSGKERESSSPIPAPVPVVRAGPVQSDLAFPDDEEVAPPAAQVSEPKAKPAPMVPAAAIGTLSVSAVTDDKDGFGDFDNMPARVTKAPVFGKKGAAPKKSSATRIMSTSAADERFESFESIEQRATKAVQEADDHKMAKTTPSKAIFMVERASFNKYPGFLRLIKVTNKSNFVIRSIFKEGQ